MTQSLPKFNPNPKFKFLIIVTFVALSISAQGQFLKYKVVKGDKEVGQMTALKKVNGDCIYYKLSSVTELKILFTIRVNYDLEEKYSDGKLVWGKSQSTLNGGVQKEALLNWKDNKYIIEHTSDLYTLEEEIKYSIPEIYFSDPKKSTQVFSQVFAEYLVFEKLDERKYLLYSDDGKNTYHYDETGLCTLVEITRPYANFNLVLVDE